MGRGEIFLLDIRLKDLERKNNETSFQRGGKWYDGLVFSGCSSGVEHNLAKVGVEGSNPFTRSRFLVLLREEIFTWVSHDSGIVWLC